MKFQFRFNATYKQTNKTNQTKPKIKTIFNRINA